jgi:excinuclease ABC subunit C
MGVLEDRLKLLPDKSGVYIMLDENSNVIYVGKAKNLKNRVRQYFFNSVKTNKVMAMVKNIADFNYIITPTEIDALSLENNLIKKHKPRYNILLKDDKTYPYLRIDLKELYPTFKITRKIKKDGAKYFGPYMGGTNVSSVLDLINSVFLIRPCNKKFENGKEYKHCLNFHLKKCNAPCSKNISREEYLKSVNNAIDFLSGETLKTEKLIREKMLIASEREEFEQALKFRDILNSIEKIKQKRITSLNKFLDADIISYKTNGLYFVISLLIVRKGIMLGSRNFSFDSVSFDYEDAVSSFITRYYTENKDLPQEIVLEEELETASVLGAYLKEKHLKSVEILCAKQGVRRQLLDMASVNATEHLTISLDKIKHKNDATKSACNRLKDLLSLKKYPRRIECYDISNVSGTDKVGSMVVFIDGEPSKTDYRRFMIKTVDGIDDYKSHQEMMRRRLTRLTTDFDKFPKPDLIVIDGGKGQLSSVKEVFDEFNITDIDLISLAEKNEEIFTLESSVPVILDRRDYALKLLQRLRDEAHRFAITYHKSLRSKRALSSVLDGVKGIGKVKRLALIEKFKDIGGIISASKEELKTVKGIGEKEAQNVIEHLKEEKLI